VTTFLTGISGVNQPKAFSATPATGVASEMLRLNTAIAPTPEATQNRLGLLGGLLGPRRRTSPAIRTGAGRATTSSTSR
jgi:hypothetical protein